MLINLDSKDENDPNRGQAIFIKKDTLSEELLTLKLVKIKMKLEPDWVFLFLSLCPCKRKPHSSSRKRY